MSKKQKRSTAKSPDNETKSAKFVRVVTPRVSKAIRAIELIGNCAGSSYEYNPAQVDQMISRLSGVLVDVRKKFSGERTKDDSFAFTEA